MNTGYITEQLLFSIQSASAEGHTVEPADQVEVFPDFSTLEMVTVTVSDYLPKETYETINDPTYTSNPSVI